MSTQETIVCSTEELPKHGSPRDRGRADAYYGRFPHPHKWLDALGVKRVELTDPQEINEYWKGYDEEDDSKDWG